MVFECLSQYLPQTLELRLNLSFHCALHICETQKSRRTPTSSRGSGRSHNTLMILGTFCDERIVASRQFLKLPLRRAPAKTQRAQGRQPIPIECLTQCILVFPQLRRPQETLGPSTSVMSQDEQQIDCPHMMGNKQLSHKKHLWNHAKTVHKNLHVGHSETQKSGCLFRVSPVDSINCHWHH
jgi:hypothetical protein